MMTIKKLNLNEINHFELFSKPKHANMPYVNINKLDWFDCSMQCIARCAQI